jgi:hypothetical protein
VEHLPAAMHLDYNKNFAFYNVFMQQAFKAEKEIKGVYNMIKAKLTIDLATPSAHSKVFRETFQMEMLKPERTPVESLDYKPEANRVFLSDNPAITQIE